MLQLPSGQFGPVYLAAVQLESFVGRPNAAFPTQMDTIFERGKMHLLFAPLARS